MSGSAGRRRRATAAVSRCEPALAVAFGHGASRGPSVRARVETLHRRRPLPEQVGEQRIQLVLAGVTHPRLDQEGERVAAAHEHRFLRFRRRRALRDPHQTVVCCSARWNDADRRDNLLINLQSEGVSLGRLTTYQAAGSVAAVSARTTTAAWPRTVAISSGRVGMTLHIGRGHPGLQAPETGRGNSPAAGRHAMARFTAIMTVLCGVSLLAACGGGGGGEPQVGVPPPPPPAVGHVRVIDADTVDIDGTRYRLFGIDAPESRQTCRTWGRTWECGAAATEALMSRAEGMSCAGSDADRYGRVIGVCSSGGEDMNAWLVAQGWALAYRYYAEDYVDQEEEARSNRRGIHRGEYVEPWNWRRGDRLEGADTFTSIASGELDVDALADRMLHGDASNVYGHWLDDSVFAIVDDTVAVSFGASPGTAPTEIGGAVWNGELIGIDTGNGERIEGDAVIDIDDFARPDVDIAFTAIEDSRGRARADLTWQNIPLVRGAFRARDMAGSIEGRFYGSNHGEVGGIFERDRLLGAFGGSR